MYALLISGAVPFLLSFWPGLNFYRNLKRLFYTIALIVIIFGLWDVFAVLRGHWSFDPNGVWPLRIINLPLEEWLFFIIIPFCCIFTWEALNYIKGKIK
jgi:lycopene cyclase domain-containing protein